MEKSETTCTEYVLSKRRGYCAINPLWCSRYVDNVGDFANFNVCGSLLVIYLQKNGRNLVAKFEPTKNKVKLNWEPYKKYVNLKNKPSTLTLSVTCKKWNF